MANENNRLKPSQIDVDQSSFAALQAIAGYAPANQAFALTKIAAARDALAAKLASEAQLTAALAAARDDATAAGWEFHNLILGAKDQVMAQFGRDSNEVQALGLKKASERKAPKRKPDAGAAK